MLNYNEIDYLIVSELIISESATIKDHQVEFIRKKGFHAPIEIDKNNVVINGADWLIAAKSLGYLTVPCVVK